MMTDLHFLILFGLICVMCPCEGQINLPRDGKNLVFKKGKAAKIDWSIDKATDISTLKFRFWHFTKIGGPQTLIASISKDDDPSIDNTTLPGVRIDKPATLLLNNVDRHYNGEYKFTVEGTTTTFSIVKVVIAEVPTVSVNCSGTTTLNEGDYFACRCEGKGGYPKPVNVTWYNTKQVQIDEAREEEKFLTLSNVKRTENGSYKCVAKTSKVTKNETSIQLIVNYKPDIRSFTSRPAEPVVGQSVTIMCVANARPEPTTYSIIFNGTEVSDDNTYTISKVGQNDAGTYVCNATNALGNSLKSYTLVVGQSTTIPTSKGNETVAKDESDSGGLGGGAIAGIVIGVLVVVVVVAGVIYWFKCKPNGKDHGSKKDAEEKSKKKRGDENVYDAVNMDDKASGSRSSHELESPMNYAVLDKQALNTGAPKKPDRNAEESTAYASIDVGKVGQVEADLV